MLRLRKYLKNYKKQLMIGPFFKLLEAIFELIVPLVMASIIDKGIYNEDTSYVLKMGGVMILLGFLGLLFALICQYSAAVASQGFGTIVRNELFSHINSLSHSELDKFGTNSLITRITNDVNQLQLAVAMLIRLVVRAPFLVIGATVMAMMLDMKLSIIFWIIAPVVALVLYIVMTKSIPYYRVRQKKLDHISLITRENLTGARVIRAFSKEKQEEKRFAEGNEDITRTAVRVGQISALLNPATFAILNCGIIAIIWFGGIRVADGSLTQGQIIALTNYMTQISLALVVVANLVVIFTKASASGARVCEILDTENTVIEGTKSNPVRNEGAAKISFEHVSMSYVDSEEYALEDISFTIEKGQTVGIIGGTGSGKSTLVNLIPRFYDIKEGKLLIDGVDIREYSFETLRSQIGIVPQKAVLFYGSILENLRWAKKDASIEEIMQAAEMAQAKEFIESMPDGYETLILQNGKNLSGGQRQRMTIARALVGDPEILILDDSSSALDYATDARLRQAIAASGEEKTVILVSQRANSLKHADKIVVMEDGRVAGIGTHSELMESCELYQEICLSQMSREEAV